MARLIRVDAELVRRKLAHSRQHASELIHAGLVHIDGQRVYKPARQMDPAQALEVVARRDDYVSRGAYKLLGALEYLGERAPVIAGRRCLDAGASTGGFTDVLLRKGASYVCAVDVGYGQLAWRLREDPRVKTIERTNIRTLDPQVVAPAPSLVVGDLSFISLTLLIEPLVKAATPKADFLLMVKPQFEVGREKLGAGGVVRDLRLHATAVARVAHSAQKNGLAVLAVAPSPLPGPAGNVEYFLHMRATQGESLEAHGDLGSDLEVAITRAIEEGPAGRKVE